MCQKKQTTKERGGEKSSGDAYTIALQRNVRRAAISEDK